MGKGGGGGVTLVTQYWVGGIRHFFLLALMNFNYGGGCYPAFVSVLVNVKIVFPPTGYAHTD